MKYIFLFTAGCLLSGLISIPAHAETFSLTIEEAEEEKPVTPLTTEEKAKIQKLLESLKKSLPQKKEAEPKLNRASFSVGYSSARAISRASKGRSASLSLSRKLSKTDTVYGFTYGSLSNSYSAGNNFNGDGFGLGAGYAHVTGSGFILNGSVTLSHSETDGLVSGSDNISASRSNSAKLSIGVSKPFVINTQDVLTPSLSISQTVSRHGKPTFRFSPKVSYARQFSPKWRGDVSIGGSGSHKNISLSGRRGYVDFGVGANYLITDDVSAGLSYTRTESTGGHHGNNALFSISMPF